MATDEPDGDNKTLTPPEKDSGGGLDPTVIDPHATPPPPKRSVATQDLSADKLLRSAPRIKFDGREVPALGGIPLLAKLGQGGMGAVYFGVKVMLDQEVAVKVLPEHLADENPKLVQRFVREAQIASRIESPHLVRVTDVSQEAGLYYLVMEYVNGVSAGDYARKSFEAKQAVDEAVALDIAIAATEGLAAAHREGIIHRDIKPDNVMLPRDRDGTYRFAAAKLADLGLARAEDLAGPTLTGANSAMGTPGYMAPEQAMDAKNAKKPADVFSMGASLYALLTGESPFKAPTTTATVVKTIQDPHEPVRKRNPKVTALTGELLDRCLAKDPAQRFADAAALLEGLKVCRQYAGEPDEKSLAAVSTLIELQKAQETGKAVMPSDALDRASGSPGASAGSTTARPPSKGMGKLAGVVGALALLSIVVWAFLAQGPKEDGGQAPGTAAPVSKTKFGIAYGREKEAWFKWAADEFARTAKGAQAEVMLYPLDDAEAQQAILEGDQRFHAWSPANDLDAEIFEEAFERKYHKRPFIEEEDGLALSPMVFVMYGSRYEPFQAKYGELSFDALGQALAAQANWETIANKAEWGSLTFGMTSPARHNSGLVTLLLMAQHFHKTHEAASVKDVSDPQFAAWLAPFKRFFIHHGDASEAMKRMVLEGPSKYDGVFTYEALAIEYLEQAEGRWGPVKIVYPRKNYWNENPYYVIDAPWATAEHKEAAHNFLEFLMSDPAQAKALAFGFRPGSTKVPVLGKDSPFTKYKDRGLRVEVPITVPDPGKDVVKALNEGAQKLLEAKAEAAPEAVKRPIERIKDLREKRPRAP